MKRIVFGAILVAVGGSLLLVAILEGLFSPAGLVLMIIGGVILAQGLKEHFGKG